ncbi:AAA-ATPase At3g50940-like [Momordica charantia]|uniref:AAA-ATPase At3g50940-like n=1 Tax=Momordica charantia TaxID=3673 RepID=A0A6J1DCI1_MOMCH|nr:AAA-ATPase At3g50940-like [Momordica charantia]
MAFLSKMPSTTSIFSAYTAFAASAMVVRTVMGEIRTIIHQILPQQLRHVTSSKFNAIFDFGILSSQKLVYIIGESNGVTTNELYRATETYLHTKIPLSVKQLEASKAKEQKNFSFKISKGESLTDEFQGIQITWELHSIQKDQKPNSEKRYYQMSFLKKHKDFVDDVYLPYIMNRANAIDEGNRVVKLYSLGYDESSIVLRNTCSFETLAMDPEKKKEVMDDLDRFVRRKDFYRRLGRAWKRGYILYGPPGTGKSSLVLAMANYLKFSIYDLELTSVDSNSEFREMMLCTADRSIIVIEDIDCSTELEDRECDDYGDRKGKLTLSGVLNAIDGLWSSCGDARIIVFTTNHKEKLDPALLRPGRMDMHIHMTYLTPSGFQILASNYLQIKSHDRFKEIEELIMEVEVTPAEIAEELMKSDDADVALGAVVEFINGKKRKRVEKDERDPQEDIEEEDPKEFKQKKGNTRRRRHMRWRRDHSDEW